MFNLVNKVAIVTGASRGIGKAIAEAIAQAGAHVVCVSRSENELIEFGISFHLNGDIINAKSCYIYLVEADIKNPSVFTNYAAILQIEIKLDDAIDLYIKSINYFPKFVDAYSNLGSLYYQMGELNKAKFSWKKLYQRFPFSPIAPDAYYKLGKRNSSLIQELLIRFPAHPAALAIASEGNIFQSLDERAIYLSRWGARWPGAKKLLKEACNDPFLINKISFQE